MTTASLLVAALAESLPVGSRLDWFAASSVDLAAAAATWPAVGTGTAEDGDTPPLVANELSVRAALAQRCTNVMTTGRATGAFAAAFRCASALLPATPVALRAPSLSPPIVEEATWLAASTRALEGEGDIAVGRGAQD